MKLFLKMLGGLLIISLLTAHLFLLGLFMAPIEKILSLDSWSETDFLRSEDIPKNVSAFLIQNRVDVGAVYPVQRSFKSHLLGSILDLRRERFMTPEEEMALNMSLLDFGEGIIGLRSAAQYYYKKPLFELSDKEWVTLINLQKIFSKK